jgi:tRNA pseudouridine38-40 synthase
MTREGKEEKKLSKQEHGATGLNTAADGDLLCSHTLLMYVSYEGTRYAGFARQPSEVTIQGELETALTTVLRRPVGVVCAGRTDAGVHARGQAITFDVTSSEFIERHLSRLMHSVNALMPETIRIIRCEERPFGFSARFDALSREYRYRLFVGDNPPLFLRNYAWWCASVKELDIQAMREAADMLIGEHDFKSFCRAISSTAQPTRRFVETIEVFPETQLGEEHFVIRVVGNAFLHSMVRTMVGTLVEVGRHRRAPLWVDTALKACDRRAAGPTAPASGLTFWQVNYPVNPMIKKYDSAEGLD